MTINHDIANLCGNVQPPLTDRSTDHKIVKQYAPVSDTLLEGVKMKNIGLNTLIECLNIDLGTPFPVTQTEGLLQALDPDREVGLRDFS